MRASDTGGNLPDSPGNVTFLFCRLLSYCEAGTVGNECAERGRACEGGGQRGERHSHQKLFDRLDNQLAVVGAG